jgi:hypothetical protein
MLLLLSFLLVVIATLKVDLNPIDVVVTLVYDELDILLSTYKIEEQNLLTLAALLGYPRYPFDQHYEQAETEERQQSLCGFVEMTALHPTIFSVNKLLWNEIVARAIFISNRIYSANLFKYTRFDDQQAGFYFRDALLQDSFLRYTFAQLPDMESLEWLGDLLQNVDIHTAQTLLHRLVPHMTVQMFRVFLKHFPKSRHDLLLTIYNASGTNGEARVNAILTLLAAPLHRNTDLRQRILQRLFHLKILDPQEPSEGVFIYDRITEELENLNESVGTYRPYWAVFGYHVLSARPVDVEGLRWIIDKAIPKYCAPFTSKFLLKHFTGKVLPTFLIAQLEHIPTCHLPIEIRPFADRLEYWFRNGPLKNFSRPQQPASITMVRDIARTARYRNELLINWRLAEPFIDYRGILIENVADAVIHLAISPSWTRRFTTRLQYKAQSMEHTAIIMASWPYLLALNRKLDVQRFFPTNIDNLTWTQFRKHTHTTMNLLAGVINDSLRIFNFTRLFTPLELFTMLNA